MLACRDGKARPQPQFHFTVQKWPVPGYGGASLAKRPHLDVSGKLCVSFATLVPLVLSKFLAGHVKGQLRLLILVAPC